MNKRSFDKFLTRLTDGQLYDKVRTLTLKRNVSLRDLYEGGRSRSIVAARKSVYLWLMKSGKSGKEIARLFDRAPSGVERLMNGGSE